MGSSFTVYVGPYLECADPVIGEREASIQTCINKECESYLKDNTHNDLYPYYCPACGTKIKKYPIKQEVYPDIVEITGEEMIDMEMDSEIMIAISNKEDPPGTRECSFDRHDEVVKQEISPEDIQQEVESFTSYNQVAINKLKKHFGRCEVKWGLFTYWS